MSNPADIDDLEDAERTLRKLRFQLVQDKGIRIFKNNTRGDLIKIKDVASEIMDQAQGVLRICMDLLGEEKGVEAAISKLVEGE